jgi:hypothetical protein
MRERTALPVPLGAHDRIVGAACVDLLLMTADRGARLTLVNKKRQKVTRITEPARAARRCLWWDDQ